MVRYDLYEKCFHCEDPCYSTEEEWNICPIDNTFCLPEKFVKKVKEYFNTLIR